MNIEMIEINLGELYGYGTQKTSEELLKLILSQYEALEYRLLCTLSPDVDVIYHDSGFEEFVEHCPGDVDIIVCALKYAEEKGFEKVVELYDGYEEAIAVIREKGE